jgi:ectoine hydroxylase-related dioxygenase (phytanoyl-CoA dioxygenase family)
MTVTTGQQAASSPEIDQCSLDTTQYARDGFLIVRSVLTPPELALLDAEAQRLLERTDLMDANNIRCRWQNDADTGECRFDCFDPVIDLSPVCERVAYDPRIVDSVSALYGERACLFKDKLIFKAPGASGYDLHQDYIAWPTFPTSFVTVIVAIDPADRENGATEVFRGYHRGGIMAPPDGDYHQLPSDAVEPSSGVVLELQPGDIAIFSGYTPHRSGPNRSNRWRRLLYLSYNAFGDGGEQREQHYAEFKRWLQERYAEHGKPFTFFR